MSPVEAESLADGLSVTMAMTVMAMEERALDATAIKTNTLEALLKSGVVEVFDRVDGTKAARLTKPLGRAIIRYLKRWKKPCYPDDR